MSSTIVASTSDLESEPSIEPRADPGGAGATETETTKGSLAARADHTAPGP